MSQALVRVDTVRGEAGMQRGASTADDRPQPDRPADAESAAIPWFVLPLFALAVLLSASLLFAVQPLAAKMILPRFGGSPAVWNTAMVFFQVALLLGYGYAHLLTRLPVGWQAALHVTLLGLGLGALPLALPAEASLAAASLAGQSPAWSVFAVLLAMIGYPFMLLSSTAPLAQRWFGLVTGRTPYMLYAISNAGSLMALILYPILVEPYLRLATQGQAWSLGYLMLVGALGAAGWMTARRSGPSSDHPSTSHAPPAQPTRSPALATRLAWLALAAIPSSLLLGVTTFLTTDITPFPMLWVIPLALYLTTFIVAFAGCPRWLEQASALGVPAILLILLGTNPSWGWLFPLHLTFFFLAAMLCHGALARRRPPPEQLTEFFGWVSLGGALGGVFNALAAPLLFTNVLEYQIALMAVCFVLPEGGPRALGASAAFVPRGRAKSQAKDSAPRTFAADPWYRRPFLLDLALPAGLLVVALTLYFQFPDGAMAWRRGLPALACLAFVFRPVRFGLGIAALLAAHLIFQEARRTVLFQERNFFGLVRVTVDPDSGVRRLIHGNTWHGAQRFDADANVQGLPRLYYDPTGPIGQVMLARSDHKLLTPTAVVGLGTGALAAYAEPGQAFDFFEIDPAVERVARDPQFFTYLQRCRGRVRVTLGDARLTLAGEPAGKYGLIILDAFSSDAIPAHLLTLEALDVYLDKLAPDGVLAFHITNNHFALGPVLGRLAQERNLAAIDQEETALTEQEFFRLKRPSHWVLLARNRQALAFLRPAAGQTDRWRRLEASPDAPLWTDDFSSMWSVLRR